MSQGDWIAIARTIVLTFGIIALVAIAGKIFNRKFFRDNETKSVLSTMVQGAAVLYLLVFFWFISSFSPMVR